MEPCIRWESRPHKGKGQFWGLSAPTEKHWESLPQQRLNRSRCRFLSPGNHAFGADSYESKETLYGGGGGSKPDESIRRCKG